MSLKERLNITKTVKQENMVSTFNNEKDILLNTYLEKDENILFCCPISISSNSAINFIIEKISKNIRVVAIGENLFIQRDEIIKFEPEKANISKELIKTVLNLKPNKIFLQDFIGVEAVDIFKLVNAGIKNVITTVMADDEYKALTQMEFNLYSSGMNLPEGLMKKIICGFVDKIVVLKKENDSCYVDKICEIKSLYNDDYVISEVFKKEEKGEYLETEIVGFEKSTISKSLEEAFEVNKEVPKEKKHVKNILARKIKRNKINI